MNPDLRSPIFPQAFCAPQRLPTKIRIGAPTGSVSLRCMSREAWYFRTSRDVRLEPVNTHESGRPPATLNLCVHASAEHLVEFAAGIAVGEFGERALLRHLL